MEVLGAYLPIDRRLALAAGVDLPDRAKGSVLFADIAGFTPLTEGLSRELGPQRGPEELTHHLNQVYRGLVDAVHRYEGSVIGFGGDAITCWFPDDDGLRAVTSAQAIHDATNAHAVVETPAGTRFELDIKVAVAVGPVRRFVVGDPALRQLDVIAGQTLDAMAMAERAARRGETVLTADAAAALGDRVSISDWRPAGDHAAAFAVVQNLAASAAPTPWPAATGVRVGDAELRRWLWPSVLERLERLGGGFLAELRPVVALFLGFGGIDYDGDADAGAKLDRYVRAVEAVLDRNGGTLLELSCGDKGSHVYAGFGAPAAAADDAARAISAAVDVLALSQDWPDIQDLRIGLARGQMRTGAYGSPGRATYSVMGDRTNLAARLMAAARPGEVVCDEAVYDRALRHWAFEALSPIQVKGKTEPVPVFRPTGARVSTTPAVATARGSLFGRSEELAQLEAALAAAQSGGQRVLGIVGEGGIGKSRLAAELLAQIRSAGLRCSIGAGQSIEQHTPYRAWRDLLADGFDLAELQDPAERRRRVETRLGANTPELLDRAPLLNDILGLDWQDNALTAGLDPALRRDSLADLVIGILREWGRAQPCLVVLDDAQWLDDLSWELVADVARSLAASRTPLLMVLALRPPDPGSLAHRHLTGLESFGLFQILDMGPLEPAATVALAAQRLGVAPGALPEAVAELVGERAEGNPFFAEELVLALRDRAVVRVEADPAAPATVEGRRCVIVGNLDAVRDELPTDVQGLVLARIDRLPAESQIVMKVASVIGRTFSQALVEYSVGQLTDQSGEATTAALGQLMEHDLVHVEGSQPDRVYAFHHIITQETAYGTLLFQQRRGMHRTVAGWYERHYGTGDGPPPEDGLKTLEPYYPLLTHHYRRAEDDGREGVYCRLAGEQAAAQYANADALEYFARALEITEAGDHATRYRILSARESVYDRTGERPAQAADISTLAAIARDVGEARWQPAVALRQANFALVNSHYGDAVAAAEESLLLALAVDDVLGAARAKVVWGKAEWQRGDYGLAREQLEEAVQLAQQVTSTADALDAQLNLAAIDRQLLRYDDARHRYDMALSSYREWGDRQGEAACLVSLAAIAGELGDFPSARRYGEQALALCRLIGHRRGLSIVEGNMAADLIDLGDYARARVHLESALRACRELGDRWGEAGRLDALGLVYHRQGDTGAARAELETALVYQRKIEDQYDAGFTLTHLGDLEADLGHRQAARDAHAEALSIRRDLEQDALAMDNLCGLARVALARGQWDEARGHVDAVRAWIDGHGTEGMEFPVLAEWTCYQVLSALDNEQLADGSRARAALERAHAMISARADVIADDASRRLFLEQVPYNRAVEAAWAIAGA